MPDIVTIDEVKERLMVSSLTDPENALMETIRKGVESAVRNFVRWHITEEDRTVLLPSRSNSPIRDVLMLPSPYVTDVSAVYEDWSSIGGQNAGVFSSDTLLTVGVDYSLEMEVSGTSQEAALVRNRTRWCPYARSIKVVYTAGLTDDQLDGDFYYIKDAVLGEIVDRFKRASARQGVSGDAGPIVSEKLKDYAVKYAISEDRVTDRSNGRTPSGLLPETELALMAIVSFYDYF